MRLAACSDSTARQPDDAAASVTRQGLAVLSDELSGRDATPNGGFQRRSTGREAAAVPECFQAARRCWQQRPFFRQLVLDSGSPQHRQKCLGPHG